MSCTSPVVLVHWVHGSVQQLLFPGRGVLRRREIGHAHDGGPVLSGASQAAAGGLGQVAAGLAGTRRQEPGLQQAQQRHLLSIGALQRQIQALRQPGPGEIQIADELAHGEHGGTIEVKIPLAGRQLPLAGVPAFQHRERHIKIAELCVDIRDRVGQRTAQLRLQLGETAKARDRLPLPAFRTVPLDQLRQVLADAFVPSSPGIGQRILQHGDHRLVTPGVVCLAERVIEIKRAEQVIREHPEILPAFQGARAPIGRTRDSRNRPRRRSPRTRDRDQTTLQGSISRPSPAGLAG